MEKDEIIKNLKKHRKQLGVIIKSLEELDGTDDARLNRILNNRVAITLFEFIDSVVNTEADIYNFLKRRGDDELFTRESIKERARNNEKP